MIQTLQNRIEPLQFLYFFTALYLLSFLIPCYNLKPILDMTLLGELESVKNIPEIMFGYHCFWWSTISISDSPVAFLGSLANFAVFTVWLLYSIKVAGTLKLLKNLLSVVIMVSVLIWPVALRIGFLTGYYLWAISCIGIALSYGNMSSIKPEYEDLLLDDKLKNEA